MANVIKKIGEWINPHKKFAYAFHEGSWEDRNLLGNKKLPVPYGFVVTTEACNCYLEQQGKLEKPSTGPSEIAQTVWEECTRAIHELERQTGRIFASKACLTASEAALTGFPLLVSVRASSPVACAGLAGTVLNLGMNDEAVAIMCRVTNNPRFVFDTYLRFLRMYGTVVLGVPDTKYATLLHQESSTKGDLAGERSYGELNLAQLQKLSIEFRELADPPQDPYHQLAAALALIFRSWDCGKASYYREMHHLSDETGVAAIVQMMVFGNMNARSGTGVCSSRNPATGEKLVSGEFLASAEGEEVSEGIRTPMSLPDLQVQMSTVYDTLVAIVGNLEKHYKDMLDIEFTVENGHLYILEARPGRRTPQASVRAAVEMVKEHMLTEREALLRIDAKKMGYFLHPIVDPNVAEIEKLRVGQGLPASPGAAVGELVFTVADALAAARSQKKVILCLPDTHIDDDRILQLCEGVIVMGGCNTSPLAIAARNHGMPLIVGLSPNSLSAMETEDPNQKLVCAYGMELKVDPSTEERILGNSDSNVILRKGDFVTIDGSHGVVYAGKVPTCPGGQDNDYQTLLRWTDKYKRLNVLAAAYTEDGVSKAVEYGADGIGICDTSNMFESATGMDFIKALLIASTREERRSVLQHILPYHREQFIAIFRKVHGKRISITLLDPRLRDIFASPEYLSACEKRVESLSVEVDDLVSRMSFTHPQSSLRKAEKLVHEGFRTPESKPILDKGDTRMWTLLPELTDMQTKAIIGAAMVVFAEGISVYPDILVPKIFTEREIDIVKPVIASAATELFIEAGYSIQYSIGAVMNTPRSCMRADAIAKRGIDYLCLDLNSLTEYTFGSSNQGMEAFMAIYLKEHLLVKDPYESLDQFGVGALINTVVSKCDDARAKVKIGAVGSQLFDAASVDYLDMKGVDYLVCAPQVVPTVKILAAQAHIRALARQLAKDQADYWRLMAQARMF